MASMKRKDTFVKIVATLWTATNIVVYCIAGMSGVAISNMGFLVFLGMVVADKRVMRWFNEK